jgi:phage major head subunit gpT-like protein
MDITPSTLNAFFQNLRRDYQSGYSDAPTFYQQVSTTIPSSSESNIYGWMDLLPQLREWIGERYVRNVIGRSMTATNKLYEGTVEVPRAKLEDDQYALYSPTAQMLGRAAKIWPDKQIADAIANGGSATYNGNATSYDGVAFFSASHPVDPSGELSSAVQSNTNALALSAANFATVLAAAKSLLGRDGAPLGVFSSGRPILMVGPTLEKTALDLVAANFLSPAVAWGAAAASAPSSNTFQGAATVLVNPYITSATAWYLIDASMPIKPFIWQLRQAPQFTQRTSDTDENVFSRDMYQWGVRARGVATYGLWFLCVRGNS